MIDLKNLALEKVRESGIDNKENKTRELINSVLIFDLKPVNFFNLDKIQFEYASNKVKEYKEQIDLARRRIVEDINSRQCVISFETQSDKPNCMLSIQFQVRGTAIYASVYQRSLDCEKIMQDTYIVYLIFIQIFQHYLMFHKINIHYFIGNLHYYLDSNFFLDF